MPLHAVFCIFTCNSIFYSYYFILTAIVCIAFWYFGKTYYYY